MLKTAKATKRPLTSREAQRLGRAVEASDLVSALRLFGLRQGTIAKATGTTERTVGNWKRTSAIRPQNADRLWGLREIVLLLHRTLTPRGVGQWMNAPNRLLKGRRPTEILGEGDLEAVREAAEAYVEGDYV